MTQATVDLQRHGDIAVLVVDSPPVNTITAEARAGMFDALAKVAADKTARALVLRTAGNNFFTGADINEFFGPPKEAEFRDLYGRFENLKIPVIAALHGSAIGGGLELALACHYRVATPTAKLMLPEVTLGIIPGAGGTQRLPRLVGLDNALRIIFDAKPIDAPKAKELGLVDAVIDGDFVAGVLEFANRVKADGPRRTSERTVDPATLTLELMGKWQTEARRLYPNRTAALTAIEAVTATARLPFAEGLLFEDKLANSTKATPEAKGAIHVFFAERETRKVDGLPAEAGSRPLAKAGVIGAGTMGGGIAIAFANAGTPVTLLDADQAGLERGLKRVDETYESMVKRGRIDAAEKARRLGLIRGSLSYADLADCDVVIEAVFENLELKQAVFRELDEVAKPGALLASNTSTLDIDEIAKVVKRPPEFIGLHFFSPANVMPLLEVIRGRETSAESIRTSMDLAKLLRKTPVLARVCYGFIGNRMMEGYAREAQRLLLEGATPRRVDSVLEGFGMAMGILAVFDMAGIDVGVTVHQTNASRYPPDPTYYQADIAMYAAGRLGQKTGRGYYKYEKGDRTRQDDPEALALLRNKAAELGVMLRAHTDAEILERCLYPLMNEGLKILEEGIAQRAGDVDVVWCSGYGFPRYRGGPMFYADTIGLPVLLAGMEKYRTMFGPMHWEPAPLLVKLVREGRTLADWSAEKTR
ncbi:MAG TPA: 3-hydroxyacyl-CoA dehydrogenase NAD-binding domain-containing protein [Steroidobacteraceae bacterium]|nr:3-hydroxyacyl-CoA dehydrogenase NAD-binding domain-containing protein [Steroidobacteraceae bacterium]